MTDRDSKRVLTPEQAERKKAREAARYAANREREKARMKAYRSTNHERVEAYRKARYAANREQENARGKARYAAKKEQVLARTNAYKKANVEREKTRMKAYHSANRSRRNAYNQERTAAKLKATPPWACKRSTEAVYFAASVTGAHVDHIVPLRGKNVCGLHWHHNLQLLDPVENKRKNAKFDPDTYVHELPEECK